VHHAPGVRRGERLGHAAPERHDLVDAEGRSNEALGQVFALDPFHGEVGLPELGHPMSHMADDARVLELGEHPPLAGEADLVLEPAAVQELEGDGLTARAVVSSIDRAHPSRSDEALDLEPLRDDVPRAHPCPAVFPSGR
jgi:hypothetical protein